MVNGSEGRDLSLELLLGAYKTPWALGGNSFGSDGVDIVFSVSLAGLALRRYALCEFVSRGVSRRLRRLAGLAKKDGSAEEIDMQAFSWEEGAAWLAGNRLPELKECQLVPEGRPFRVDSDSCKKTVLASILAETFGSEEEVLLRFDDVDVWPSCTCMPLFDRLRAAEGVTRTMGEAPVQLVSRLENDALFAFLCLMLYFNWGGFAINASGTVHVTFDDDEFIVIRAPDTRAVERVCQAL